MSDYVWHPTSEHRQRANVARLMRKLGEPDIDALRRRSVADIGAFWENVIDDLDIRFNEPFAHSLDISAGVQFAEWFVGGRLNVFDTCIGRWASDTPTAPAVVHEDENGHTSSLNYDELSELIGRARSGLRELGIQRGDAVALYLPMIPEAVVAAYAVVSLGAVLVPLFSGFAAGAIASRLCDADVKVAITAGETVRRGTSVPMLSVLQEALGACPTVEHVVVVCPDDRSVYDERFVTRWTDLIAREADDHVEPTSASDTLLLVYTSGTTGRPKGAVHTHAGFLAKVASEVAYGFDLQAGETFCWITDMGWIMGPLSVFGTHAVGGTLLLYEGAIDVPDERRLWRLTERHRVAVLGVSPTLIRTLRAAQAQPTTGLSSVRSLGSTGEPWDKDTYDWLGRDVFNGRVPIINFSGGTEVGGSFLCPYPTESISSASLGGPALGMDVDVVDPGGRPIRGSIGELVCRQPWPSMTRGVWKDDARYLEVYWSAFPNLWRHGDYALIDSQGDWFILGRSDDVMNVAGKRVAPAEIESVVMTLDAVAECAVIGVPDVVKGEAIQVFWVSRGQQDEEGVAHLVRQQVGQQIGRPFVPSSVRRVEQLPKTRTGKILRRAVRAAALGTDAGDLSGAENPEAIEEIRALVQPLVTPLPEKLGDGGEANVHV